MPFVACLLNREEQSQEFQKIKKEFKSFKDMPVKAKKSDAMSKDLKRRGFKFVGSTICYAFMQAAGMVNDHTVNCFRYKEVKIANS